MRRGKYQDGVPYQAGQEIQPTGDGSVTHILEAFGVSAGGETINFKRVTDEALRKMESGAKVGENVAEVEGDGAGDGEYSNTDKQKPIGQLSMANQKHPNTGVLFDGDGFPIFDTKFNATITPDLYMEKDRVHFLNATKQLSEYLQSNPAIKSQFSERQLKQIALGLKIDGYVWYHHQTKGVLQLVDEAIHRNTWHIGGRSIWGGGALYRR